MTNILSVMKLRMRLTFTIEMRLNSTSCGDYCLILMLIMTDDDANMVDMIVARQTISHESQCSDAIDL